MNSQNTRGNIIDQRKKRDFFVTHKNASFSILCVTNSFKSLLSRTFFLIKKHCSVSSMALSVFVVCL